MRTLATYLLRAIWLSLSFVWGWHLVSGKLELAIHPYNVVLTVAIVVGTITIWFSIHDARMLAGICGVIAALMLAYQVWTLVSMFSGFPPDADIKYRAFYGPIEFEGLAALISMWLHPLLLLGFSGELVVHQWRYRTDLVRKDEHQAESRIADEPSRFGH